MKGNLLCEPMPSRPIRNLTEWFDELPLEDKLLIHKYMTKRTNKKIKKMEKEMNESMKKLNTISQEKQSKRKE